MGKKSREKISNCRGCRMAGGKPACTFRFAEGETSRESPARSPFSNSAVAVLPGYWDRHSLPIRR